MENRAKIAKTVCPKCEIHTDQHPMPPLAAWREYAKFQPYIGNPCLYYVIGIETTKEKFTDTDWEMLKNMGGIIIEILKNKNPDIFETRASS
ncbi:MAG: hypothetical protein A2163_09065 [Actinobacteria bacterium RBG_13_35_12]|nr:MAG: hypothetical protein A2163_09065 [Actinobacteria bacterium RBG_13_35_12]